MKKIYLLILVMFIGIWSMNAQKPIPKTSWSLVSVDSEETTGEDGAATNSFDGDVGTFWHTDWATTGDPYPHEIVIDLGASYDIIGFQFTPRTGNTAGVPDTFALFISTDNVTWDSVAGGLWDAPYDVVRTEAFTKTGQYFRFVGVSGQGTYLHTVCAEFDILVLGADFEADQTTIMRDGSVNFTDLSGNSPVKWVWTFEGGTPATSTDQHPSVTYNTAGNYDVQLISIPDVGDPSQNDTTTYTNYITVDIPNISQADWSVVYVNSTYGTQVAENVFDGDPGTIWHSDWAAGDPYPHTIIIDLGATYDMEGFSYTPRSAGGNGTVDEYEFYVTKDLPSDIKDGTWGTAVSSGTWFAPWDVVRSEFFGTSTIGRYIIFYMLSEKTDASYASCSEINVKGELYGAAFTANKTEIFATQSVDFTDLSSGTPSAWEWTFTGGDPATSADQNPSGIKYTAGGSFDVQLVMTPPSGVGDNDTLVKAGYINVQASPTAKPVSTDGWSVVYVDSEEPGQVAEHVFDLDPETIWHTGWSAGDIPYPHELVIDLGANYELVGFAYSPRSGGGNGTVSQYEFLTSIDAELYDLADSGTWVDNWSDTRTEMFAAPVTSRFIKFLAKSEKAGNAWASCSELVVFVTITGVEFGSNETFIEKAGEIDFVDFSAGDPTGWSWTFEGGTPSSSTEQSPLGIVYNDLGTFDVTLITTGGTAPGTLTKTDYVTVDYAIPGIGTGVYIDTVEIGKVMANYTQRDGGYVDYTDIAPTLIKGETYSLKVTHVDPWGGYDTRQGVWIDWNNDGFLDVDTETMLDDTIPVNFTVPATAVLGTTRMRVLGRLWGGTPDPYEKVDYGEIEDYSIVVADLAAGVPVAAFSADTTKGCEGSMIITYTDESTNTPTSWAWTFAGGTPASSDLQNPVVSYEAAGTFDVSLTATQTSGTDDEVKAAFITVNGLPAVLAGDDDKVCRKTEVTLSGAGADSYEWNNGVVDGVAFIPTDSLAYIVTGTDANGCVNTDTVSIALEAQVDTLVTMSGTTLTANAAGATLQWIDCSDGSAVSGETNAAFTPTANGDYAVVVNDGTCSDTSSCYTVVVVGIFDNDPNREVSIYPNPSQGQFNVILNKADATIKVYNSLGTLVLTREKATKNELIELNVKGLYIIEVESDGKLYTRRLVIQ